jgi:protein TonB
MSKKLNETGKVIVAVYFNSAGFPKSATVAQSSGFPRLDRAAVDAVMQSQITPIPGGSEGTTYTFNAPINFVLSE